MPTSSLQLSAYEALVTRLQPYFKCLCTAVWCGSLWAGWYLVESPGFDPLEEEEEEEAGHRTSPDNGSGSRAGTLAGRNVN